MSSKYYNSSGKEVSDGDIAYADDLNVINQAIDSGFQLADVDIQAAAGDAAMYSAAASASADSAAADAIQTAADRVQTGLDRTQTGLDRVSTTSSASSASSSASSASTSASTATTKATLAGDWAEKAEDVEVTPGHYSALHWAAKALENAGTEYTLNVLSTSKKVSRLRLRLSGANIYTDAYLKEFDIRDTNNTRIMNTDMVLTTGVNNSGGSILTAASGYEIEKAFDGNTETYWQLGNPADQSYNTYKEGIFTLNTATKLSLITAITYYSVGVDIRFFRYELDVQYEGDAGTNPDGSDGTWVNIVVAQEIGGTGGTLAEATRVVKTSIVKDTIALSNVDNTSDTNKPISTATQTALNLKATTASVALKANIASPTFTGVPAGPTATVGTSTTQFATTAFVMSSTPQSVSNLNTEGGIIGGDVTVSGNTLTISRTSCLDSTLTIPMSLSGPTNVVLPGTLNQDFYTFIVRLVSDGSFTAKAYTTFAGPDADATVNKWRFLTYSKNNGSGVTMPYQQISDRIDWTSLANMPTIDSALSTTVTEYDITATLPNGIFKTMQLRENPLGGAGRVYVRLTETGDDIGFYHSATNTIASSEMSYYPTLWMAYSTTVTYLKVAMVTLRR